MSRHDWDKFASHFHPSWERKIRPFIESEACERIYDNIRKSTGRGKTVVPDPSQTFRVFKETNMEELKVMIMGMAPYHTKKDGKIIADGILMSCSNTGHLAPSLEQFYNGMEGELFKDSPGIVRRPDLSYLCHQGIFMFNASLTCELLKAGSHLEIWQPFTKYVLEEIITASGVPIIWLGKDAAKFDRYVNPFQWRFSVSHPASASHNHTTWSSEGVFGKVNAVLKDYNNFTVSWAEVLPF